MIEPGIITLEILISNPYIYMVLIFIIPIILGGISAYFADRAADEKKKSIEKIENPEISKERLNDVYEFEHIRDPIVWGMMAVIVVVLPIASKLDSIGDWSTVWSTAILAGLVSRTLLSSLAGKFLSKQKE